MARSSGTFRKGHRLSKESKGKIGNANRRRIWKEKSREKTRQKMKGNTHKKGKANPIGSRIGVKREKHPNWKGGKTSIGLIIRNHSRYIRWRQDVFIRDDFTCRKCGTKGGQIQAHHVKPFSRLLDEVKKYLPLFSLYDGAMIYSPLWDIDNGITICTKCHNRYYTTRPKQ